MTTRLELVLRLPDDDTVWRYRDRTWAMWRRETGLEQQTLMKHLRARGWTKGNGNQFSGNGMTQAPCRLCNESFKLTKAQRIRTCPDCVTDRPETALEREYQKHLERIGRPDYEPPRRVYTWTPHVVNRQVGT